MANTEIKDFGTEKTSVDGTEIIPMQEAVGGAGSDGHCALNIIKAWFDTLYLAIGGGGTGDMEASTYDPTNVAGDCFDVDNHVDGTTNKVFTAAEKAEVAANTAKTTNATHTGDVTGSGALTIANDAVTYAKMQNVSATARVLGRNTAGSGDVEEITEAQLKTLFSLQTLDTDTAKLDEDQSWTGSQRSAFVVDNDGNFDQDAGNNFKCTPTGTVTIQFTNEADGQSGYIWLVNTGGHTINWGAEVLLPGGTLVLGTGTHLLSYVCDGTNVVITAGETVS